MPNRTQWLDYARIMAWLTVPYLILAVLLRVSLWWLFAAEGVSAFELPGILLVGFANDLIVSVYLLFPLALLLLFAPPSTTQRKALLVGGLLWLYAMLYIASAEYFFFEEFNARFNLVAVDYLIYPHEVFINIWESYPVVPALIANAIISLLVLWGLSKRLHPRTTPAPFFGRLLIIGTHAAFIAVLALSVSTQSLIATQNRLVAELSINGVSSFFEALHTNELDYPQYYRTAANAQTLLREDLQSRGGTFVSQDQKLDRYFPANPNGFGKLNVVMIAEESFGAEFVESLGGQPGLTPEFDNLSTQGLFFTHAYSTGTRTVRGLEALVCSFPPIPSESIIKRPGNEGMASLGSVLHQHGYQTSFLYGGYSYFDNMGYFFEHNGFDVSDRSAIDQPKFANIWGVSDEDLFNHALAYFDARHAENTPFFSVVLTTSNHKPYTFPAGIPGVKPEGGGREAGIRYADYALGKFIEQAKQHAWFDNTVFVIAADHGARVYGKAQIPLHSYEIPILVLASAHIQPRQFDRPMSQVDVAPTVLGLLGLEYTAPFFGQDVLAPEAQQTPVKLLFNHNHDVALYYEDKLAVLGLQKQTALYHYDTVNKQFTVLPADDTLFDLAAAHYETAFNQFKQRLYQ